MNPLQFLKHKAPRLMLAASLLAGGLAVTPAGAFDIEGNNPNFDGFEIDGNLVDDAGGGLDWGDAGVPTYPIILDDTDDSGFASTSRELAPGAWVCEDQTNPTTMANRTDLLRGYVNQRTGPNGDEVFLDLAVVREFINVLDLGEYFLDALDESLGETGVSAEISENAFGSGDGVACPHTREDGALLVDWTFDNAGAGDDPDYNTTTDLYSWLGGAWTNTGIGAGDGLGATNSLLVVPPSMGDDGAFLDPFSGAFAFTADPDGPPFNVVQDRHFAEASINLTDVLGECQFEGFLQFRSRANNAFEDDGSDLATLEDRLPALAIRYDVCGTINIVKATVNPDINQNFAFTGDLGPFTLNDGAAPGDETETFEIFPADDIDVTETNPVPDGFDVTDLSCVSDQQGDTSTEDLVTRTASIDLSAGETVTCTYTNTERASVTIIKDTQPDGPQDFTFNAIGPNGLDESATLDDDADDTLPNSVSELVPANPVGEPYVITEEPVEGFVLADIDCLLNDVPLVLADIQVLDEDGNLIGIEGNLPPGSELDCTFVNHELATVTIVKDTTPDGPQDFTFNATGPNGFVDSATLDDDADPTLPNSAIRQLLPNPVGDPYVLTEVPVPGFALVDIDCTLNGVPVELPQAFDEDGNLIGGQANLPPGVDVVCVFRNSELPSVTIIKDTQPNGPQDFTFNATGPDGFASSATLDDDADGTLSNTVTVDVLPNPDPADPYIVTEEPVAGFDLTDIDCFLNGVELPLAAIQVLDLDDNLIGVSGNLEPADDLICTFVNEGDAGDLTVGVEGGDPEFVLTPDPQGVSPFELDEDEEVTFEDLPAGVYTLTMTDIEDGLVLDGIDCDPEEISTEFAGDPSITFAVVDDAAITCIFTVSEEEDDDDYDQYPGDNDFDFDTPFDDADDDDPAPVVEVAGENTNQTPPAEQPVAPVVLPETAAPGPETAPQAVDTLPRTGSGASNMTIIAGLFLTVGGLALVAGRRRRASSTS